MRISLDSRFEFGHAMYGTGHSSEQEVARAVFAALEINPDSDSCSAIGGNDWAVMVGEVRHESEENRTYVYIHPRQLGQALPQSAIDAANRARQIVRGLP